MTAFDAGFGASLAFFGLVRLLYAWLIVQSGFVPRPMGIRIAVAGLCCLINSFAICSRPISPLLVSIHSHTELHRRALLGAMADGDGGRRNGAERSRDHDGLQNALSGT